MRGPSESARSTLVMLLTASLSAIAQITTGSVVGTVKDAQGGVIPGATVTLTSETKGTVAPAHGDQRDRRLPVSGHAGGHLHR